MPFGLKIDEVLSMIVPVIILLIIPALDRNDKLHPLDRPGILALALIGLTWLIELSVWSAIQPGVPVNPSWATLVMLPPLVIIIAGIYVAHRSWVSVRDKALNGGKAESAKSTSWVLSKPAASIIGYVTAILTIIIIALSLALNPISDGPFIGISWGAALLLLSASIFSYFYTNYI